MDIKQEGDAIIFHLPRRCEGGFSRKLFSEMDDDHYKDATKLVFDFKDTGFIDSSTIGILITINRKCKSSDVSMSLRNINKEIRELFSDTGLSTLFTIEDDGAVNEASVDLFLENLDVRLDMEKDVKNGVCIFHLNGVFNHPDGSNYFKQQVLLAIVDHEKILLDFEHLTFFDSLSVSVVLSMFRLLSRTGGSLRFCNANYLVNDLFSSLNIDQIIPVFKTVDDALAEW